MRVSVISPVFNEEKTIGALLESVIKLQPDELIVVDGGSSDGTREICRRFGVEVFSAPHGRAAQMNYGAALSTGEALLFLHADTRLPPAALDEIRALLDDPRFAGGHFAVKLDGDHWMLRVVGAMISLRSRLSKVGTGDQAIFVRRETFQQIGGFPDMPLMEDVAFGRALKLAGGVACLRSKVITSARRWQVDGVWRTILRMWALKSLYLLGVSPARLKRYYGDAR